MGGNGKERDGDYSSLATGEALASERQNKLSLLAKINFLDTGSAVLGQIRVY
jgi:hypothetical protein